MKQGRVVILLAGRHAGKKAIIVRQYDEGKKVRPCPLLTFSAVGDEVPSRSRSWY